MARSEAQKRAEKTYRSKQATFLIKWNEEMLSRVRAEAERQGDSAQAYIHKAILNQLKADRSARSEEIESINNEEEE